eukprot:2428741-Pyramimonas_sp.AAC.1
MRLDVVCVLIHRREFLQVRDRIVSIHIFSDASDCLGSEVQGMVADFAYDDGTFERRTLPGCSFAHGFMSRLDQALAFLWVVFLICGPAVEDMRSFLSQVRSTTTDVGAELYLVDCVDILDAFHK